MLRNVEKHFLAKYEMMYHILGFRFVNMQKSSWTLVLYACINEAISMSWMFTSNPQNTLHAWYLNMYM